MSASNLAMSTQVRWTSVSTSGQVWILITKTKRNWGWCRVDWEAWPQGGSSAWEGQARGKCSHLHISAEGSDWPVRPGWGWGQQRNQEGGQEAKAWRTQQGLRAGGTCSQLPPLPSPNRWQSRASLKSYTSEPPSQIPMGP